MRPRSVTALVVLLLAAYPRPATSQIRASEPASVSQTVDGTEIRVEYSRPRARGRDSLFGGVVPWGQVWTPGANDATTLVLGRDVEIEGRPVPAGRWSVWMVTDEGGDWELVLDPRDTLFHTAHPEPDDAQIRFPVRAEETEAHVETLTWSFPAVASDGTTLVMAWGGTRVALDVEVEPSYRTTVPAAEADRYVGEWTAVPATSGTGGAPGGAAEGPPPGPIPFDVRHDDGELRARTLFPGPEGPPAPADLLLLPKAEGIFLPAVLEDGEIFNVETEVFLEFEFDGERAVAFAVRSADTDQIILRGERKR